MMLRVNRRKANRDSYLAELQAAGIEAFACHHSEDGIRLAAACDVTQLPGFAEGHVSVQDEAAQLAAGLLDLAAGQQVLDACCAPGGKPVISSSASQAWLRLSHWILESKRLQRVQENLDRLQLEGQAGGG